MFCIEIDRRGIAFTGRQQASTHRIFTTREWNHRKNCFVSRIWRNDGCAERSATSTISCNSTRLQAERTTTWPSIPSFPGCCQTTSLIIWTCRILAFTEIYLNQSERWTRIGWEIYKKGICRPILCITGYFISYIKRALSLLSRNSSPNNESLDIITIV